MEPSEIIVVALVALGAVYFLLATTWPKVFIGKKNKENPIKTQKENSLERSVPFTTTKTFVEPLENKELWMYSTLPSGELDSVVFGDILKQRLSRINYQRHHTAPYTKDDLTHIMFFRTPHHGERIDMHNCFLLRHHYSQAGQTPLVNSKNIEDNLATILGGQSREEISRTTKKLVEGYRKL